MNRRFMNRVADALMLCGVLRRTTAMFVPALGILALTGCGGSKSGSLNASGSSGVSFRGTSTAYYQSCGDISRASQSYVTTPTDDESAVRAGGL